MASNATPCPICSKPFSLTDIENHVNKCLFLNGTNENEDMSKRRSVFSESQSPSKKVKNNIPQVETKPSSSSSTTKQNGATFTQQPLAKQVEPKTLSDFIGQDHVVGEKTILRSLLEKCDIPNMILWGPPGCGKTSLSSVVRGICQDNPKKLRFVSMCATSCGVKDVQNVVATAKLQTKFAIKTVLFMDEIHRFNKKQQDIFLMHVEKGDITLIGATTENPSFTINAALLSRCRVIVFEKLQSDSLLKILENSLMKTCGNTVQIIDGNEEQQRTKAMKIEKSALEWLADISDGDARIALGNLQLVLQFNNNQTEKTITISDIQDQIKKSHMLYDRKGEEHYNTISAMHMDDANDRQRRGPHVHSSSLGARRKRRHWQ